MRNSSSTRNLSEANSWEQDYGSTDSAHRVRLALWKLGWVGHIDSICTERKSCR